MQSNRNYFMGQSVLLYNRIPKNRKAQDCPISQLKKVVKRHLGVKGYYHINDFMNDNTPW